MFFESIVIEESDSIDAAKELDQAEHKIKASKRLMQGVKHDTDHEVVSQHFCFGNHHSCSA